MYFEAGETATRLSRARWTCALNFGALYCDCGADLAGFPLFGST